MKTERRLLLLCAAAALMTAVPGCSIQKFALRSVDDIFDNTMNAVMEEEDLRLAEQAIASDLKLIDALIATDPENVKLLQLGCQGYTSYALAFADDSLDRARMFYLRAQRYGKRAMALRGFPDSLFNGDEASVRGALAEFSPKDVPLVFWTVNAWGSAVNLQRDNPDAIAQLPTVNAMMGWVKEKDSTLYYGGPLLYFGVFYGSLPTIFGGNPAKSKNYFDRAVAVGGGRFLMTDVFYAKTYAVQTQDQELFTKLLTRVLDASIEILPEQRLANAVAKLRARQLLAKTNDLF